MNEFDDYYESSEIEQLQQEFSDKAWELVKQEIKNTVNTAKRQADDISNQRIALSQRERELFARETKLADREKNLDTVKKEMLAEFVRELGLEFTAGQEVWVYNTKEKKIPCSICGGSGKVSVTNTRGETVTIKCPNNPYNLRECTEVAGYDYTVNKSKILRVRAIVAIEKEGCSQYAAKEDVLLLENESYSRGANEVFATEEQCIAAAKAKLAEMKEGK